jgi:conserved hypothetical transmembrane protein; putative transmembrane protein
VQEVYASIYVRISLVTLATENNKRIAKNTFFLYCRMILVLLVSLYTSRIVLEVLGIEDFGIYNIVGGVVAMFSFLNSSMTSSTQRFLTFDLGQQNIKKMCNTFSVSLNIHILIALLVLIFTETIGLWFVNYKLVIPAERLFAANIVFQTTILALVINIVQVPYNSLIIAYEKMSIYAYVSILEVLLKLLIVYILQLLPMDKLSVYGGLLLGVQFIITMIYRLYCKNNYPFCSFRLIWDKQLYVRLTGFAGWNLFGSLSWLLRVQGVNLLLNLFFGPLVNAARGIAFQVNSSINNFVLGFQTALNPQITKNYALNDIERMEILVFSGIKYSYFLLYVLTLPIMLNVDFILSLWLREVPQYTNVFLILVLIDSLVSNLFGGPLMTSLSATGNIRKYQIYVSSVILLTLPIVYFVLYWGSTPYSAFIISIFISLFSGILRFYFCSRLLRFSVNVFLRKVIFPVCVVSILVPIFPWLLLEYIFIEKWYTFIFSTCICFFLSFVLIWLIGMNKEEHLFVKEYINKLKISFKK